MDLGQIFGTLTVLAMFGWIQIICFFTLELGKNIHQKEWGY